MSMESISVGSHFFNIEFQKETGIKHNYCWYERAQFRAIAIKIIRGIDIVFWKGASYNVLCLHGIEFLSSFLYSYSHFHFQRNGI